MRKWPTWDPLASSCSLSVITRTWTPNLYSLTMTSASSLHVMEYTHKLMHFFADCTYLKQQQYIKCCHFIAIKCLMNAVLRNIFSFSYPNTCCQSVTFWLKITQVYLLGNGLCLVLRMRAWVSISIPDTQPDTS